MSSSLTVGIFLIALIAIASRFYFNQIPRAEIPSHMINHHAAWVKELISPAQMDELNDIFRGMVDFPSNLNADLKTGGFVARHEHIGEARPVDAQGRCDHNFLIPDVNGTQCIIPQRVDIGKHYILTGGPDATREPYEKMISRLNSFGKYMFNVVDKYPVVSELFAGEKFQQTAKSVCPANEQVLDPFQFNFIVQVPGQTVALHIDGAYFWGATRREFPQWLLACMVFSGLYKEKFINQVQVVGYLHYWDPLTRTNVSNGDFVYYDDNSGLPKVIPAVPGSGAVIDGSKVIHAARVYRTDLDPPEVPKDKESVLHYAGGDRWEVLVDGKVQNVYTFNDLRIAIVYRARCFRTEEDKIKYYNFPEEEKMKLEDILDTLKNDLVKHSTYTREKLDALPILDLAFLLMDHYIKYPLPPKEVALVPYNYCALPRLFPIVAPLFAPICK